MDLLADFLSQYRPVCDPSHLPNELTRKYDLLSCLKQRGARQVLLLRDKRSLAKFILKIAPLEQKALLEREQALMMRLHGGAFPHPALCFQYGAHAFLLREYVAGRSLAEIVEDEGPLAEEQAVGCVRKALSIVRRLHGSTPPLVHRDIKPQNLILAPDGSLRLVDLDTAEDVDPGKSEDTVVLGTTATAAPEQFGYQRCDERTDVYAIGMLLTFLLTGEYAPAALKGAGVSRRLRRVIARCLRFDPRGRFPSADALAKGLDLARRPAGRLKRIAAVAITLAMAAAMVIGAPRIAGVFTAAKAVAAEPAYAFASPLVEQAVRLQLGRPFGAVTRRDLLAVSELDLFGKTPFMRWEDLDSRGRTVRIGSVQCDGYAVLGDVSDFANMPNLRRLSLYRLSIRDIGFLSGLPLTHLGLGGNRIRDLSTLANSLLLQELDISDNPVTDLGALSNCRLLTALDISATGVTQLPQWNGLNITSLEHYEMPGDADDTAMKNLSGAMPSGASGERADP
jgi:hypothetical protein